MISNVHLAKVGGGTVNEAPRQQESVAVKPSAGFREILANQIAEPVQFSKHAALRLNDRNIELTGEQISRVADGIGRANQKGIRDSLVLVDDVALVVNVKSRTVITAVAEMRENVFSNIDGAVIV